jgi:hypothetical protein
VAGVAQRLQHPPDLLDTTGLPQIHIHDEHAIRPDQGVAASKHASDQFVSRVEHRADRRELVRFIRYEMDEHVETPPSI